MQQHQLGALRSGVRVPRTRQRRPFARRTVRAGEQHQRVGLPHAQAGPRCPGRGSATYTTKSFDGFDDVEPVAGVRGAAHAPHQFRASELSQRFHELAREPRGIDFDVLRKHR